MHIISTEAEDEHSQVFGEDGKIVDEVEVYDKKVLKFLAEFEWYIEALKNKRDKGIKVLLIIQQNP